MAIMIFSWECKSMNFSHYSQLISTHSLCRFFIKQEKQGKEKNMFSKISLRPNRRWPMWSTSTWFCNKYAITIKRIRRQSKNKTASQTNTGANQILIFSQDKHFASKKFVGEQKLTNIRHVSKCPSVQVSMCPPPLSSSSSTSLPSIRHWPMWSRRGRSN